MNKIRLPPLLLLRLLAALAYIHLGLSLKLGKYSYLAIALVFWLAIASTINDRYHSFKYESDLLSIGLGIMAIALSLIAGAIIDRDLWLNFAPFSFVLGTTLLASGIKNIFNYRSELIVMTTLGLPKLWQQGKDSKIN